ncbi:Shr3 amino acid permease chaperone [Gloeopeniophorella convolvens]|nr:Shr3 amino acid permease chaperone [Gloeopeniophorella convolvens]
MGFRQGALLATVCFLFGVLLACFTIDYRVLFETLTEDVVEDGFQYYRTFYNAPPGIKALLHGLMGIGVVTIIAKIHRWDESAMFFDGGSLVAFIFAIAMYTTVTIPAIQTVVAPVEGVDTRQDQVEAMRVLSAGNTLMMALLGGILALQGGQEWARRLEARELAKIAAEEAKVQQAAKKDQ